MMQILFLPSIEMSLNDIVDLMVTYRKHLQIVIICKLLQMVVVM
jgi:hypothetical protein